MKSGTRVVLGLAGVAVTVAVVTYLNRSDPNASGLVREVRSARRPVRTLTVQPAVLRERLQLTGVLEAKGDVTLTAEVGGRVVRVHKEMGDPCEAGTPVLTLDAEPHRIALAQAEAARAQAHVGLRQAERDLTRTRQLADQAVTTGQTLERAEAGAASAEAAAAQADAAVQLATRQLQQTSIRCPFAGVVAERLVHVGQLVGLQTPLMRLVDTAELLVTVTVPPEQLGRLRVGQPAHIRATSAASLEASGRVARLGVAGDRVTRAFPVEIHMSGRDTPLRPGMVVHVEIDVAQHDTALAVPRDALVVEGGNHWLWRVIDGRVERMAVRPGARVRDRVVIDEGLSPGDEVVVVGAHGLTSGAAVDVVARAEEDAATAPGSRPEANSDETADGGGTPPPAPDETARR